LCAIMLSSQMIILHCFSTVAMDDCCLCCTLRLSYFEYLMTVWILNELFCCKIQSCYSKHTFAPVVVFQQAGCKSCIFIRWKLLAIHLTYILKRQCAGDINQ
jgi:hypothetical protein